VTAVGSPAENRLKSVNYWNDNPYSENSKGTDNYGFSAMPGGYYSSGSFSSAGYDGRWWMATGYDASSAYYQNMSYVGDSYERSGIKSYGYSVRCVEGSKSGEGDTKYQVTVSSIGTGASGSGSYAANATVIINAGTAPSGQKFKNWTTTSGGVTFANANSAATTFTMPANAVTVTAMFETNIVTPGSLGSGTFTDARDGKTYKYVTIGGQTWMAENLNYDTANGTGSWCYGNKADSCVKYGRLYRWHMAMAGSSSSTASPSGRRGVCPSGWHLPSRSEWGDLVTAAGGSPTAEKNLKSTYGWYNNGNGVDSLGFSALPGGYCYNDGGYNDGAFFSNGDFGYWWTATAYNTEYAYHRKMHYDDNYVNVIIYEDRRNGFSVRCIRD
jgi:uncharacterized protein (TIGR02145 family)